MRICKTERFSDDLFKYSVHAIQSSGWWQTKGSPEKLESHMLLIQAFQLSKREPDESVNRGE